MNKYNLMYEIRIVLSDEDFITEKRFVDYEMACCMMNWYKQHQRFYAGKVVLCLENGKEV